MPCHILEDFDKELGGTAYTNLLETRTDPQGCHKAAILSMHTTGPSLLQSNMEMFSAVQHLLAIGLELCVPPADEGLEGLRAHGVGVFAKHGRRCRRAPIALYVHGRCRRNAGAALGQRHSNLGHLLSQVHDYQPVHMDKEVMLFFSGRNSQ